MWPVLHISYLVMNRFNLTEPAILISLMYFLLSNVLTIYNLFMFYNLKYWKSKWFKETLCQSGLLGMKV